MSKKYDQTLQWDLNQDLNGITDNAVFPEYIDQGKYQPHSLVDDSLETIDPTPNVHSMFVQFNEKFFWNKLLSVQVRWSQRMTTCAGTCTFHPRNRECIIALSAPLLKFRPRKDLVETLLHEMIHGYLFLTSNNRDRDGHGTEFRKHMNRINRDAGTNITIYHNFYDEVKLYKQHWWRCNGPCQNRAPYFGMVRRAMNRAPGSYDYWFKSHQMNCGGEFIKIREPEIKLKVESKNRGTSKSPEQNNTIDRYLNSNNSPKNTIVGPSTPINSSKVFNGVNKENGLINGRPGISFNNSSNYPCNVNTNKLLGEFTKLGTNTNNVYGFGTGGPGSARSNHLETKIKVTSKSLRKIKFSGVVGGNSTSKSNLLNKYFASPVEQALPDAESIDNNSVPCPVCQSNVSKDSIDNHIDICLKKSNKNESTSLKRQKLYNSSDEIDSIYLNNLASTGNLFTCPICHEKYSDLIINIHVDDCLLRDNTVSNMRSNGKTNNNYNNNIKNSDSSKNFHQCPICSEYFDEDAIFDHVNVCLNDDRGITNNKQDEISIIDLTASPMMNKINENNILCPTCYQNIKIADYIIHVDECLATVKANSNKNNVIILDDDIYKPENTAQINNSNDKYKCLVCNELISKSISLNEHLDYCVTITYRDTSILESRAVANLPLVCIDDNGEEISGDEEEKLPCPICMRMIEDKMMTKHVDDCIKTIN